MWNDAASSSNHHTSSTVFLPLPGDHEARVAWTRIRMSADVGRFLIRFEPDAPSVAPASFKYQQYYLMGMNTHPAVRVKYPSTNSALLAKLFQHNISGAHRLRKAMSKPLAQPTRLPRIGRYVLESSGARLRFAIDAADTCWVADDDTLAWADIYFKCNTWPSHEYDNKVEPLINGNATLNEPKIKKLRSLRETRKSCDIVYWTKLWEPKSFGDCEIDGVRHLVEHQIRIFENLAALNVDANLLAVLPNRLKSTDLEDCRRRLESAGVRCQIGWGNIGSADLWQALASARIVMLRPGNHLCISWRLIDLFCMGACVVYDGHPFPQWYEPFVAGEHFIDGNCRVDANYSLPSDDRYESLKEIIADILADGSQRTEIGTNAVSYFERHGAPEAVVRHILKVVQETGDDRIASKAKTNPNIYPGRSGSSHNRA